MVTSEKAATRVRAVRCGFNLVELLVVIAIVALLVALLMPAIQAARESARRTVCQNNLKQLALGCLEQEGAQGHFPSNGWGWRWVGDPKRGYGKRQPGGWAFNILPYIEEEQVHKMGNGVTEDERRKGRTEMTKVPIPSFYCPSRREVSVYPFTAPKEGYHYVNVDDTKVSSRSDYAVCAGSRNLTHVDRGPDRIEDASTYPYAVLGQNGVSYQRSEVRQSTIERGTSKTFLLGEKFVPSNHYATGNGNGDRECIVIGHGRDITRWTGRVPLRDKSLETSRYDYYGRPRWRFGSAHHNAVHMAYCDGHVAPVEYGVIPKVFRDAGDRRPPVR